MDNLQWYDYFRLAIAIMAVISMYRLAKLWRLRGDGWSPRLRDIAFVFFGFLFATLMGMLEQVITDVPYGYRSLITFIVVIVSIRATRYSDEPLQKF